MLGGGHVRGWTIEPLVEAPLCSCWETETFYRAQGIQIYNGQDDSYDSDLHLPHALIQALVLQHASRSS